MSATGKRVLLLAALVACWTIPAHAQSSAPAQSADQHAVYRFAAALYGLDPELLEAIASIESGGDANAVSPKGAQGLMQLMPETGKRFGVKDPFNPVENTLAAARFLSYLRWWQLGHPGQPAALPEVLAAYNAGPGAVQKFGGIPPYPETEAYVRKVLIRYLFGGSTVHLFPGPARPYDPALAYPPKSLMAARTSPTPRIDVLDQLSEIRRCRAEAERREKSIFRAESAQ